MLRLLAEGRDAELIVAHEGSSGATSRKKPAVPKEEDRQHETGEAVVVLADGDDLTRIVGEGTRGAPGSTSGFGQRPVLAGRPHTKLGDPEQRLRTRPGDRFPDEASQRDATTCV
jgi:hypothetical protein